MSADNTAPCEACGTTEEPRRFVSTVFHGDRWLCTDCKAETLTTDGPDPEEDSTNG